MIKSMPCFLRTEIQGLHWHIYILTTGSVAFLHADTTWGSHHAEMGTNVKHVRS